MNKGIFFGYMMMPKADLVAQVRAPKRHSRRWHTLCAMIWDLGAQSPSLAQKHLST